MNTYNAYLPKKTKRVSSVDQEIWMRLGTHIGEIKSQYGSIIDLGAGYPDIPPSVEYIEILKKHLTDKNSFEYPGYKISNNLVDSITNIYKKKYNTQLPKNSILPLSGSNEAISFISQAFLDNGDEVLIPDPGYPTYTAAAKLAGAKIIYYTLNSKDGDVINLEELKSKTSKRTKLLWLNFPNNPTGCMISKEELGKIVQFAKKNNIIIAYDNAYVDLVFSNQKAISIFEIRDAMSVAIELFSFSKSWSLPGFRIGYLVGNPEIVARVGRIKAQYDFGLPIYLQEAASEIINKPDTDWQKKTLEIYKLRKEKLGHIISTIGLEFVDTNAALYFWIKIPNDSKDSESFVHKLLDEKQIFVFPGILFGPNSDRYIRLSICREIKSYEE